MTLPLIHTKQTILLQTKGHTTVFPCCTLSRCIGNICSTCIYGVPYAKAHDMLYRLTGKSPEEIDLIVGKLIEDTILLLTLEV